MRSILIMMMAVCTLAACKKDNTTNSTPTPNPAPTPTKTNKELITGTWLIVSVTSNDPGNPNPLPDCSKDDILTFKADGTCIADAGAKLCDSTQPQTLSGTWNIDGYPKLTWDVTGELASENTITQLDANTLKMERKFTQVNDYTFVYTWKRQ